MQNLLLPFFMCVCVHACVYTKSASSLIVLRQLNVCIHMYVYVYMGCVFMCVYMDTQKRHIYTHIHGTFVEQPPCLHHRFTFQNLIWGEWKWNITPMTKEQLYWCLKKLVTSFEQKSRKLKQYPETAMRSYIQYKSIYFTHNFAHSYFSMDLVTFVYCNVSKPYTLQGKKTIQLQTGNEGKD